jgi:subtilase family serine protease
MRGTGVRTGLAGIAALLVTSILVFTGHARSASAGPATSGPSKSQRVRVLTRALTLMHRNYRTLGQFTPGPEDVFDYQVGDDWKRGIDGTGTTVAVLEGWSDPGIAAFMAGPDKAFGLPEAQIKTIFPTGRHRLPPRCPPQMVKLGNYGSCRGWVSELELDVLSVHMMAPYAKILITVAPPDSQITDDAASNVAPPEFMEAVEYLAVHHLANVISISDGTGESTYRHGSEEIYAQDAGELTAAAHGIPVLVATGDCDAAQHLAVGPSACDLSKVTRTRATAAWDDSPWVTAVGGTIPNLSATGQRLGPDRIWNFAPFGFPAGEGAGFSAVFTRPAYQNRVAAITRSKWRSVPDFSMNASDGTSEAAPLLAGVLALATQLNHGKNVGPINNVLYNVLGPAGLRDGVADVVSGNNTLTVDGKVIVRGFAAAKGFDVASGWGTIRANTFVPALVRATQAAHQDVAVRARAAAALTKLERRVELSRFHVSAGGSTVMTAQGFLPGHPVTVYIDGRKIITLHADGNGSVSYRIRPSALGLPRGRHVLRLVSMLITSTDAFHSR